jgi:hypothetical protein
MKIQDFRNLPGWLQSNVFYRSDLQKDSSCPEPFKRKLTEVHPLDANLISSEKANGNHALMLDLDQNSFVVDSSTPEHKHVYIDADLSLEALEEIITVLAKHGIVQYSIKQQIEHGKCLTLRPPGVVKGNYEDELDVEEYKTFKSKIEHRTEVWKQFLATKTFDNSHLLSKELAITISNEFLETFLSMFCTKLGLDKNKIVFVSQPPVTFHNNEEIIMSYRGSTLSRCFSSVETDQISMYFTRSDIETDQPIPEDWPTWQDIINTVKEFYE